MTATTTTERPILFTPAMAQAVFEGRKTQTRRLVKPQPTQGAPYGIAQCNGDWTWPHRDGLGSTISNKPNGPDWLLEECPYGQPGDRLFVREAVWLHPDPRAFANENGNVTDNEGRRRLVGWSGAMDGDTVRIAREYGCRQRPNIHMPRWACRSVLEVVSVRVERVEAITEADAIAEGAERNILAGHETEWQPDFGYRCRCVHYPDGCECFPHMTAREWFLELFYDINKRAPRGSNPWVWVIEFTRLAAQNTEHA